MNARVQFEERPDRQGFAADRGLADAQLDALEEEAIFILREVAAAFERPARMSSPRVMARVQGAQPMLG